MGAKGDKSTQDGQLAAELIIQRLSPIEGVTSKKMFGGHGIFHHGQMFGIVDSKGHYFLKADDTIKKDFLDKGASQHSRMPYYSIPEEVFENEQELMLWARKSISINKK
jgi:DNA transformation protein